MKHEKKTNEYNNFLNFIFGRKKNLGNKKTRKCIFFVVYANDFTKPKIYTMGLTTYTTITIIINLK